MRKTSVRSGLEGICDRWPPYHTQKVFPQAVLALFSGKKFSHERMENCITYAVTVCVDLRVSVCYFAIALRGTFVS